MNLLKYLLEGIAVAVVSFLIPGKKIKIMEVVTIGLIAAVTFLVLDLFAPSIGVGARQGSGFGVGFNMIGGEGVEAETETMAETESEVESEAVPEGFTGF